MAKASLWRWVFWAIVVIWFGGPAFLWGQYGGGSGTAGDPYLIGEPNDLIILSQTSNDWDKHFKLTADLDMVGVAMMPIGNTTTYVTGTFNGNGHTIANLSIHLPETTDVGLFGVVDNVNTVNGTITDLGLVDPDISGRYSTGSLVGWLRNGTLTNCYSDGGTVSGEEFVGGLIGDSHGAINNCYASVAVSGRDYVGGLVGSNDGLISNCYATGSVSGEDSIGGLAGGSGGPINHCYFLDTAGPDNGIGFPRTEAHLKAISTFYCWAEAGVWTIDEGNDMPRLFWEQAAGIPITPAAPVAGSGTINDPFLIDTVAQFVNLLGCDTTNWDKHFRLRADLDFAGGTMRTIGYSAFHNDHYDTDFPFSGTFDGGGHIIANLSIYLPNIYFVGLFGNVDNPIDPKTIYDLGLVNVEVNGNQIVSSLVGILNNGTISACFATGMISGEDGIGGLVGINNDTIRNCYFIGQVIDTWYGGWGGGAGLVAGNWQATITTSYAAGLMSGSSHGLVGYELSCDGIYDKNFWDTTLCFCSGNGSCDDPNVIGESTANMQKADTFINVGWDFVGEEENGTEDIWRMCVDGVDYPRLSWEFGSHGDWLCPDGVNYIDYSYFEEQWLNANCAMTNDCDGVDLDLSGDVGISDLQLFSAHWMAGMCKRHRGA